jgi:uncharacterized protein (TIGR02246 family)
MVTDEELIFRETEGFMAAWNRGDAEKAASYFADDGVRVGAGGDVQHGRMEIEAGYRKLFSHGMPSARIWTEKGTVRILAPDLAIWQGRLEIQPAKAQVLKGHVVQVMKKAGDRWLILEAHPKIFPH